jgi:hypothetical protein
MPPIVSYVRSGLFLLVAAAQRGRKRSDRQPSPWERLQWAGLDAWREHLLRDAQVAPAVSAESSLLLIELPAVRRVLRLVRRHRQLARRYVAAPYRGRLTLVHAVPEGQDAHPPRDPTLGWQDLAAGGVELHTIRTMHVALLVKPYVEVLAREVMGCLDQISGSPPDVTERDADAH